MILAAKTLESVDLHVLEAPFASPSRHIYLQACMLLLNDKNTTIFNLKYRKGFLILVSGKGMEILFYFKRFLKKNYQKAG